MAESATEERQMHMHNKLLFDVVFKQAGTLAKALMEGVMNSIDARATWCDIKITETFATIADNGTGITSKADIAKHFETFGHPHSEEEAKIFGKFRMGRGQLFAYGKNTWTTGPFTMRVDAKKDMLKYKLITHRKVVKGCRVHVDLYDALLPTDVYDTVRTLTDWCKYAGIQLTINDELVTVDPTAEKWDHVLDEAYIRLIPSTSMSVYNLGIHTMEWAGHRFGTGGVIVSRKQLQVNFARNDVQDTCPVWRKIKPFVMAKTAEKIARKAVLTDDERQRLADQIRIKSIPSHQASTAKVLTTVNGKHISFDSLSAWRKGKLTVCPAGNLLGDKLYQRNVAIVLATTTLDRFHTSDLRSVLDCYASYPALRDKANTLQIVPFSTLTAGMDTTCITIDEKQMRPLEHLWLMLIDAAKWDLKVEIPAVQRRKYALESPQRRRMLIGAGPAAGWTDGSTHVHINRDFLDSINFTMEGFYRLGVLLLHEYCHSEPSTAEHLHTQQFYELYHDSSGSIGNFVQRCLVKLPECLRRFNKKMTTLSLRDLDAIARANRALRAQPVIELEAAATS